MYEFFLAYFILIVLITIPSEALLGVNPFYIDKFLQSICSVLLTITFELEVNISFGDN